MSPVWSSQSTLFQVDRAETIPSFTNGWSRIRLKGSSSNREKADCDLCADVQITCIHHFSPAEVSKLPIQSFQTKARLLPLFFLFFFFCCPPGSTVPGLLLVFQMLALRHCVFYPEVLFEGALITRRLVLMAMVRSALAQQLLLIFCPDVDQGFPPVDNLRETEPWFSPRAALAVQQQMLRWMLMRHQQQPDSAHLLAVQTCVPL